ncbi:Calcium-transporting ATPase 1 [Nakaseomyces bracarensis]|uniref:Calcium-transporting ATPase n=1 Tax=Nakaseomyces bracarensis TaxID=273131 RepID=A0ABR4NW60_9SACH
MSADERTFDADELYTMEDMETLPSSSNMVDEPNTETLNLLNKPNPSLKFCSMTIEETLGNLDTDIEFGLSSNEEVMRRREIHGFNEFKDEEKESLIKKFFMCFVEDRLILLLIGSAVLSFVLGHIDDAVSISLAILIVVTVGFIQEYRSEKSLEALNKLVPTKCHVIRCGREATSLASELVPGDLIRFQIGDRIPADLRIVEAADLSIDESNLTGETNPVHKDTIEVDTAEFENSNVPVSDRSCIAFMGTLVKEGRGKGIVIGTGTNTSYGAIYEMVNEIEKPRTPLQETMDKLGKDLSYISFFIIAIICIVGVLRGNSWLQMFQISVSLAVAAIPEGLPIIVTVTLALGVLRMTKRNAIVRRLPSVETLGSVNVICSDKTGTLTTNHMTVAKVWSYSSHGVFNNALSPEEIVKDELTSDVKQTILIGNICNNTIYSDEHRMQMGNPTDVAVLEMLDELEIPDARSDFNRKQEITFNSRRKFMAVRGDYHDSKQILYVKGAFERILSKSVSYLNENGEKEDLDDDARQIILDAAYECAAQGLRTIGCAYKDLTDVESSEEEENSIEDNDINALTFTGLFGLADPPRPTVPAAIKKLIKSGVHIIMITGDSENTAVSIAEKIGIPVIDRNSSVMTGERVSQLTEDELSKVIDKVNIFARATPENKLNIVKALQKRGDIVAMTGDGVNDAPALKLADIGVSMGIMGTDVAKEVSDMILTDDDFSSILTAIEEGKGIFNNIQNFLTFQLSISVATLALIAITTIAKLPAPLNPMQILWINIIMDGPPAQSLGVEPVDPEVMDRPPRSRDERILSLKLILRLFYIAACILIGTFYIFLEGLNGEHEMSRKDFTMTFTGFVFFAIFNAIACRHSTKSIFQIGLFTNKIFNVAIFLSFSGQMCAIYLPFLQHIFKTEFLPLHDILKLLLISSSVLIIDEIRKLAGRLFTFEEEVFSSEV